MESNTTQDMKPAVSKTVAGMLIYLQVQNSETDHMASVDKAADFLSGKVPFHILSETPTVLFAVSCGFCKFLQANARIISRNSLKVIHVRALMKPTITLMLKLQFSHTICRNSDMFIFTLIIFKQLLNITTDYIKT